MRRLISALLTVSLIAGFLIGCENPIGNTTKSSNADLSGLTISTGTLSPTFAAGTTAYTVSVPNATASISITGTKADSNAILSSNNGVAQSLNVGANTITISVTAQDGTTTKDYIVTVTRAKALSTNADLSTLTVSTGTLSPAFSSDITAYTVSVPNSTASIIITGIKTDSNATLSANNGVAQDLNIGTNNITITVTAQDDSIKNYSITVIRDDALVGIWVLKADTSIPSVNAYIFNNDNSFIYKATSTTNDVTTYFQTKGSYVYQNNVLTLNHNSKRSSSPDNFSDEITGWSTITEHETFYTIAIYNDMMFKWANKSSATSLTPIGTWTSLYENSFSITEPFVKDQLIFNSNGSGISNQWRNTSGDYSGAPTSVANFIFTYDATTYTITAGTKTYTCGYHIWNDYLLTSGVTPDYSLGAYLKQ